MVSEASNHLEEVVKTSRVKKISQRGKGCTMICIADIRYRWVSLWSKEDMRIRCVELGNVDLSLRIRSASLIMVKPYRS